MEKIFVIIVTYNATQWIDRCFSSLRDSSVPVHTIVIDNNSSDDTVARLKTDFPDVTIVETGENSGFAKANNIGFKKALELGADYFFLLNQDAWVEVDTISKLLQGITSNPEYGIVSPVHFNGKGDLLDYGFYNYISKDSSRDFYSQLLDNKADQLVELGFVNAAAWLVSKACLMTVGGFSPFFPHYGEDMDLAFRVQYHQLKIGVVLGTKIFHDREERMVGNKSRPVSRAVINSLAFCSNLSVDLDDLVRVEKKIMFKRQIKSLLKFDFKSFVYHREVLKCVLRKIPELKKYRSSNQSIGLKYLD